MSRTILILLVVGTCLVAPWPVFAQSGLGGIVDSVSRLDRNFDAADRNRDGLLSREEAGAGHVAFVTRNFDAIDTAKRGLVSKDDVHAFIQDWLMRSQAAPAR